MILFYMFYREWYELRARALVSATALAGFSSLFILVRPGARVFMVKPYDVFVRDYVYGSAVRLMFVIFAIVLGVGGLGRERALGTAAFTIALPVNRWQLMAVRAAAGIVAVVALALAPTFAVVIMSPVTHESYALADALRSSVRWSSTGALLFAVPFFLSAWSSGEYTALAGSIVALFGYLLLVNAPGLARLPALNIIHLMDGDAGSLPAFASVWGVAGTLVACAARLTARQDF